MIAFGLTAAYMLAEVVGGLVTGSLALLSDAARRLIDPPEVPGSSEAVIAAFGLAINIVTFRLLRRL